MRCHSTTTTTSTKTLRTYIRTYTVWMGTNWRKWVVMWPLIWCHTLDGNCYWWRLGYLAFLGRLPFSQLQIEITFPFSANPEHQQILGKPFISHSLTYSWLNFALRASRPIISGNSLLSVSASGYSSAFPCHPIIHSNLLPKCEPYYSWQYLQQLFQPSPLSRLKWIWLIQLLCALLKQKLGI